MNHYIAALSLLSLSMTLAQHHPPTASNCTAAGSVTALPDVPEASGLAASGRANGRLYAVSDSGDPIVFVLDARGKVTQKFQVPGVEKQDWEAIGVGACPAGSCIYIGDIGDNNAARKQITIYRLPEPEGANLAAHSAEVFYASYPDGAQDAETMLVTPTGRVFIVSKGETGPIALYAFPAELRAGAAVRLNRVGESQGAGAKIKPTDRITDGAVSADGQSVVLRTANALLFYRAADLFAGNWRELRRADLSALDEPQGEGVAFGADNVVYVAGEGGGKSKAGTFARVVCGR